MLKVVRDAAPEQFGFAPLLIVLLVAAVALVTVVFLLRYRRKGDSWLRPEVRRGFCVVPGGWLARPTREG